MWVTIRPPQRTQSGKSFIYSSIQSFIQPQHAIPDIFIWLIANGKRIAYHRLDARDVMFSEEEDEAGIYCGKVQTIFLKVSCVWFVNISMQL